VKLMAGGNDLDKAKRFLERCDFVGLTEKFNLSLEVFGKLAPGKLSLNYQRMIVARNNKIQKSLRGDPKMVELIREHNRLDLELYDFAVNEIFPKICRKAGMDPADKGKSYEIFKNENHLKYKLGRAYNKVFRQIYKARHKIFYPGPLEKPVGHS
jgi:hypothetical protein